VTQNRIHKDNREAWIERIILMVGILASCILLLYQGREITGPYIFGDEELYTYLARHIQSGTLSVPFRQYNCLYPLMMAPFYFLNKPEATYWGIRIMNAVVFSLSAIPIWFSAKRLKISSWAALLIALVSIFMPIRNVCLTEVAESVCYLSLALSMFGLITFIQKSNKRNAVFLGVILGINYLLKPGLIVVAFGVFIGLAIGFVSQRNKQFFSRICLIFVCTGITALPVIIFNALHGQFNMGYDSEFQLDMSTTEKIKNLLKAFGGHTAALLFALILLFGVLWLCTMIEAKKWSWEDRTITWTISIMMLGLLGISVFHRIRSPELPFLRYAGLFYPALFILVVWYLTKNDFVVVNKVMASIFTVIGLLFMIVFTPLSQAFAPYSNYNSADLCIWQMIATKSVKMDWTLQSVSQRFVIVVPIVLGILTLGIILCRKKQIVKVGLIICSLFFVLSGYSSMSLNVQIGESQSGLNDFYYRIADMESLYAYDIELNTNFTSHCYFHYDNGDYYTLEEINSKNLPSEDVFYVFTDNMMNATLIDEYGQLKVYEINEPTVPYILYFPIEEWPLHSVPETIGENSETGLVSNGIAGALVYGQYASLQSGTYRITYTFSLLSDHPEDAVQIRIGSLETGNNIVSELSFADMKETNTFVYEYVLTEDITDFETVLYTYSGTIVSFQSIVIERIELTE